MNDPRCWVCQFRIHDDPHTHHAEGCPKRFEDPIDPLEPEECAGISGCGEDVHGDACCPTCNPTLWKERDGADLA